MCELRCVSDDVRSMMSDVRSGCELSLGCRWAEALEAHGWGLVMCDFRKFFMNNKGYIFFLVLIGFNFSSFGQSHTPDEKVPAELMDYTFVNEYGTIFLRHDFDSLWTVSLTNNEGFRFNTAMIEGSNTQMKKYGVEEENHFLKYSWGGLSFSESRLRVLEFASYGQLQDESKISQLYQRDFFNANKKLEIEGEFSVSKRNLTIDGFYLDDSADNSFELYFDSSDDNSVEYHKITGTIVREPYPKSFYSTSEFSKEMFPNDGKIRYRLRFVNYKVEALKNSIYKGYPVNLSTGEAAIAYEYADSEAYILKNHLPWTVDELKEKITVEGYLVQKKNGSFLKNWKIVDGH
jgi:hypothetical protein